MSKVNIFTHRLIRIKSVIEITELSKSYIYQLQADSLFPQSVQIIPEGKSRAWVLSEVEAWIQSRIDARDDKGATSHRGSN